MRRSRNRRVDLSCLAVVIARFQEFFEVLRAGLRHSCHSPVPVARGAMMGLVHGVRVSVASQGCCSAAVHCVSEGVVISELAGRAA